MVHSTSHKFHYVSSHSALTKSVCHLKRSLLQRTVTVEPALKSVGPFVYESFPRFMTTALNNPSKYFPIESLCTKFENTATTRCDMGYWKTFA